VEIVQANFLDYPKLPTLFDRADMILVNNVLYGPDTNLALFEQMKKYLKKGAAVVAFEKLSAEDLSRGSSFKLATFEYNTTAKHEVSWTAGPGRYYVYTKLL
jgi:hypothetical protein